MVYWSAFKSVLISNMVVLFFNFSVGFGYQLSVTMLTKLSDAKTSVSLNPAHTLFSDFFVHTTIIAWVVTAAIFRRTVPLEDGSRLTFGDALALSGVYYALGFVCILVLGVVAVSILVTVF